jgi:hypothetical protein
MLKQIDYITLTLVNKINNKNKIIKKKQYLTKHWKKTNGNNMVSGPFGFCKVRNFSFKR